MFLPTKLATGLVTQGLHLQPLFFWATIMSSLTAKADTSQDRSTKWLIQLFRVQSVQRVDST
jgi:hypothetical protein